MTIWMELALTLTMFAPAIVGAIILCVVIAGDIQTRKVQKRYHAAVDKCIEVRGLPFTSLILTRCCDNRLPMESQIEVLEHHIANA